MSASGLLFGASPRRRAAGVALIGAAAVLACSGCGGAYKSADSSAGATNVRAGATVRLSADAHGALSFIQSRLAAPKPGKVTLVMTNPGTSALTHAIAVQGKGVSKSGPAARPGKTSTVTVTLRPGAYLFYCPVDHHATQGMKGSIDVGPAAIRHATDAPGAKSGGAVKPGAGY
jgi:uncharacterized cupredoxin-like copper-binding protein